MSDTTIKHLAIIMDGNGRWAKERGLNRTKGHEKGADVIRDVTTYCAEDAEIESVETFGNSYSSSYRLFSFIKFSLKIFIAFMAVVSLLLIIKQMEIWKFTHMQRMQVMEIFGAPLMLRSGVLFKIALIDALVATAITSIFFLYIKFGWATQSGIDMMVQNQDELFRIFDIVMLLFVAICIVIMAVTTVVMTTKGVEE